MIKEKQSPQMTYLAAISPFTSVKLSQLSKVPVPQAPCLLWPAAQAFWLLSTSMECQLPVEMTLACTLMGINLGTEISSPATMPNLLYLVFPHPQTCPLLVTAKQKFPPEATFTTPLPSSSLTLVGTVNSLPQKSPHMYTLCVLASSIRFTFTNIRYIRKPPHFRPIISFPPLPI